MNAEEHYKYLVFILSFFGKDMSNVVAVTGGSCNTNRSMAILIGPKFAIAIVFNLSMRDIIEYSSDTVAKVQQIMRNLSF